jgi:hypothetical protein
VRIADVRQIKSYARPSSFVSKDTGSRLPPSFAPYRAGAAPRSRPLLYRSVQRHAGGKSPRALLRMGADRRDILVRKPQGRSWRRAFYHQQLAEACAQERGAELGRLDRSGKPLRDVCKRRLIAANS